MWCSNEINEKGRHKHQTKEGNVLLNIEKGTKKDTIDDTSEKIKSELADTKVRISEPKKNYYVFKRLGLPYIDKNK